MYHMYISISVQVCMYNYVCVYIYICCMYMYVQLCMCVFICCMYMYGMCVHIYVCFRVFEACAKLAQLLLVCASLGRHIELINKQLVTIQYIM